jgi:hypothetical protein
MSALRLNTRVGLPLVRILDPGDVDADTPHSASREGPPAASYIAVSPGERVSALNTLAAYSDEPDWGMDRDLFDIPGYEYTREFYVPRNGVSSQAAFHMAFLHEPGALKALVPALGRTYMGKRIELFMGLARIAFKAGCEYWGWRFAAWAMHYAQDITQPYHASPFPPGIRALIREARAGIRKSGAINAVTNGIRNRHFLFEAVVHFCLNHAVKTRAEHDWINALQGESYLPFEEAPTVLRLFSRDAAHEAGMMDAVFTAAFGRSDLLYSDYALRDAAAPDVPQLTAEVQQRRGPEYARFSAVVTRRIADTGFAGRSVLRRILRDCA